MLDCDRLYTSLKYSTFNSTVMYLVFRFQYKLYGWVDGGYSAIEYPFNYVLVLANLGSRGLGEYPWNGVNGFVQKNKCKRSLNFFLS